MFRFARLPRSKLRGMRSLLDSNIPVADISSDDVISCLTDGEITQSLCLQSSCPFSQFN